MKQFLFLLCCLLLLVSCGSSSDTSDTASGTTDASSSQAGLQYYDGKDFGMYIPASWEVVNQEEKKIPEPKNGTLELAVSSKDVKSGFSNNLIVLSQNLEHYENSKDYSMMNNVGAQNDYLNYTKIEAKDFEFADGETSYLYVFDAKYTTSTPVLRFVQTAYICQPSKAFFFTLALPSTITDTTKYEEMLKTFECKE